MVLSLRRSYSYLLPVLLGIAALSLLSSVLFQVHLGKPTDLYHVLDLSFYHAIPVILWILVLIPLLHNLIIKFPLHGQKFKRNLLIHVLISLGLAPVVRIIAITLDFWIKSQIGMIDVPILPLVMDVKWVILGSLPKAFFEYWLASVLLSFWQTKTKGEIKPLKHLILPAASGSDIVPLDDILWIEADGNYVMIHTASHAIRSRKTFKNLCHDLTSDFIQVHRSKIINREAVSNLRHWRNGEYLITLVNGAYVTSTRTFLPNVRKLTA